MTVNYIWLLPGPLWPKVVAPVKAIFTSHIELFDYLTVQTNDEF